MNNIFAKKITILHKNGFKCDYTFVTEFKITEEYKMKFLLVKGEVCDIFEATRNVIDKIPIKDLQMTIIDWNINN